MTRIYTRTGDDGTTGLANGERVPKCDPRIEACGDVDETNCALGLVLAGEHLPVAVRESLIRVQHELFDLGAELASGGTRITAEDVARLEADLDRLNADLPPLREFILPAGNASAARCHLARAVCRRAERRVWALARSAGLGESLPRYLNRLSDLLFVAARCLARADGAGEVSWQPSHRPAE